MAIDTFTKLQTSRKAQKVMLFEIELSRYLNDWSKTGGRTNVYQIAFSLPGASDNRVSRVREDDNTWYERCGDVATCDNVQGSFYYDDSAEVLYVHASDSGNPAAKVTTAYVKFFFANETKKPLLRTDTGIWQYYLPWLRQAPSVRRSVELLGSGAGGAQSIETAVLDNSERSDGTGFWDEKFYDWIWFGAEAVALVGGESLPYSQYRTAGTFLGKRAEKNFEEVSVELADNSDFLDRIVTDSVFASTDYTYLEDGKEGEVIPVGYGHVRDVSPTCINTTTEEYQLYDHRAIMLAAYDNNNGIHVHVGFSTDNDNGKFTLNATPVGNLTADCVGLVGTNEIGTNESFEIYSGGFTGWTEAAGGGTIAQASGTSEHVEESYGVQFITSAGSECSLYQNTAALVADQWYRVAFYGKADSGVSGSKVCLEVYDATAGKYLNSDHAWQAGQTWCLEIDETGDMIGKSLPFQAQGANAVRIKIGVPSSVASGCTCYADLAIVAQSWELEGDIVQHIADNKINMASDQYNATSLVDIDSDSPYPQGIYINKRMTARDVIARLNKGSLAYSYIDRSGQLTLKKWEAPSQAEADVDYTRFTFKSMKEIKDLDSVRSAVSLGYGKWLTDGKTNYSEKSSDITKYKYRITKTETIETQLAYQADADTVAQSYLDLLQYPWLRVELVSTLRPLLNDLGDTISLDKRRFNKDDDAYLRVIGITDDFNSFETRITAFKLLT